MWLVAFKSTMQSDIMLINKVCLNTSMECSYQDKGSKAAWLTLNLLIPSACYNTGFYCKVIENLIITVYRTSKGPFK